MTSTILVSTFFVFVGVAEWVGERERERRAELTMASLGVQTTTLKKGETGETAKRFSERFQDLDEQAMAERKADYKELVNEYYDLATTFYEWAWGENFHFGLMFNGETRQESLQRHEHWLALKLGLKVGQKVVDVGCGVGGPARTIARFSGAEVVGINNNAYQIGRAQLHDVRERLQDKISYEKADFLHMPAKDGTFDAAYSIEATCHAPEKVAVYGEIFRTLKPGGLYACYEWCMTDKFDPENAEHKQIKLDIMTGNGLPDIDTCEDSLKAMIAAGFELVEECDLAHDAETVAKNPVPWYSPIAPGYNPANFKTSWLGQALTNAFVSVGETVRLMPSGTYHTQSMLMQGATGLFNGGRTKTFTPMYFMLMRKPEESKSEE
jgi:sterol 24-C-methyltransferase